MVGRTAAGGTGPERATCPARRRTARDKVLAGKILTFLTTDAANVCAVDDTDAAYGWGWNEFGQLGDNSTGQRDSPALAGPAGAREPSAVRTDGAVQVSWSPTARIGSLTANRSYTITVAAHTTAGDSGHSEPITIGPAGITGPIASGYRTSKCVDDSADSAAEGAKMVIWHCNGGANQQWKLP